MSTRPSLAAAIPPSPSYVYRAELVRVVDGDTLDAQLDLGMRMHLDTRLRLPGLKAPGFSTAAGRGTASYLRTLLPVGSRLVVRTYKPDPHGRALADVRWHPEHLHLGVHLTGLGLVQPYE